MPEVHSSYSFDVRWLDGKRALATSADGLPDLEVGSPPQFGGPGGVWTPEHFFLGAATTCWLTTFLAVAELSKLELSAVSASGEAFLEKGDDRRFSIARILLRPRVAILREGDREKALRLIQKAEDACLVARSIRTEVTLEPQVDVATAAPV